MLTISNPKLIDKKFNRQFFNWKLFYYSKVDGCYVFILVLIETGQAALDDTSLYEIQLKRERLKNGNFEVKVKPWNKPAARFELAESFIADKSKFREWCIDRCLK